HENTPVLYERHIRAVQRRLVLDPPRKDALAGVDRTHRIFPLDCTWLAAPHASSNSTTARSARMVVRSRSRLRLAASNQAAGWFTRAGSVKPSAAFFSARSAAWRRRRSAYASAVQRWASSILHSLPATSCSRSESTSQ